MLENLVFRELYRRYGNIYETHIYYYTDAAAGCDFIVFPEESKPLPVQVSWSLANPDTRSRELKGLLRACTYCKSKEGWIITAEEEETIEMDEVTVQIKPAWKWLLYSGKDAPFQS